MKLPQNSFRRGVAAAASVAADYDASSTHPYRLGDCILAKLNLREQKPRRNARKLQDPEGAWLAGFAVALAEMHRLLLHGNNSSGVCAVARDAGLTLAVARAAGVSTFDLKELRKAGVR